MDVKKVAYELSGPCTNAEARLADNGISKPPEYFHKNVFLAQSFD